MKIKVLKSIEISSGMLEPGIHTVTAIEAESLIMRGHARPATAAEAIAAEAEAGSVVESAAVGHRVEVAAKTAQRGRREVAAA